VAVIYSKQTKDTLFEVRTHGQTVRLYSNGVLHSQYNPNHIISGAIWDLLVLPSFFKSIPPKNALVLGLGGGTVVHMIRHFYPECEVHCIEREMQHIQIARRFFKIPKDVKVIKGDAYEYLEKSTQKYDWILDDVFQHAGGEPERGVAFSDIFKLYKKALAKNGVLSMNTIGNEQLKELKALKNDFESGYVFRHPLYENAIISFFNNGRTKTTFFNETLKYKALDTRRKTCRLKVTLRSL